MPRITWTAAEFNNDILMADACFLKRQLRDVVFVSEPEFVFWTTVPSQFVGFLRHATSIEVAILGARWIR